MTYVKTHGAVPNRDRRRRRRGRVVERPDRYGRICSQGDLGRIRQLQCGIRRRTRDCQIVVGKLDATEQRTERRILRRLVTNGSAHRAQHFAGVLRAYRQRAHD
jgi:hypothetical protein